MTPPVFKPGAFVFECDGTRPLPPRWDPSIGRARRPWWHWLALLPVSLLAWIVYRALAGWPIEGHSLFHRLAG